MAANTIFQKSNRGIVVLALVVVLALDQITKWLVLHALDLGDEKIVVPGFFKLVHWGNTGAAWSCSAATMPRSPWSPCSRSVALLPHPPPFQFRTLAGQIAFGLIFGGTPATLPTACCPAVRRSWISFIFTCSNAAVGH